MNTSVFNWIRLRPILLTVILLFSGMVGSLAAQDARLQVTLPAREKLSIDTPQVRAIGMVSAKSTAELIRNGFPARLQFRMELWSAKNVVNEIRSTVLWDVIVEYDALKAVYRVVRVTPDKAFVLGEFKDIEGAEAKVAEAYKPQIKPPRKGEKSYYSVSLDVEAMSMSDLDEVGRWIKGELKPAVRGKKNPGTAVTKGLRRFVVKVLGGERLRYQDNSKVFTP